MAIERESEPINQARVIALELMMQVLVVTLLNRREEPLSELEASRDHSRHISAMCSGTGERARTPPGSAPSPSLNLHFATIEVGLRAQEHQA